MLAKITLYDGTVYKIASQTVDTADGLYLGRIKDELSLVSAMQEAGNAPATINLTIINDDDFIPHSKDLWAAEVLLTNDNGVSWRGKINFCNFDADGNLYLTASEKTAPELELQLPDEVRQVYTVDEDFHQSSVTMTIPLVIGGTNSNPITLPTILIDKTEGVYLICVGEIRNVVKVYNGVEELPNTAYTAYTGTSSQAEHAGFAYVKINEDYRLNADGSYAEINVEVVGLKLGDFTEEECRNGALFLYYFLTTSATGVNGWGCGIDQSELDTASFQSAITLCNQLGYKLDGIMWLRQSAQSWIDQICQAIHGKYSINANGKRSLFIDYAGNASKKTFTASNMRVDKYGKNSYTSVVYNKGILSYDYNPITGLFMQSAQYENADSIAQIGEQKFVGESYLIKDATTALAVLEYTCKRSQIAAEAIEFDTDAVETNLRAGDIITINRPDLNLNNALYQIQSISTTDFISNIIAVKFDTSVFNVTGTASTVNWGNERDITPALTPAMATSLYLSTGFDINPDGTGTPYISGTFTVPAGGWLAAAVQYGIGADPTNWTELALITDGRFKISPVNVGTVYSVRIRMITATGHSDYLRGQITATGDSTAPSAPTIAVKATDKTVTVQCGLDNPPYDMGGFQVYRKKSTDSVYTLIGSVAANRGYAAFSDYVDEYVTYNYKAKSYDRSGNLSGDSSAVSVTVTGITANDVAATALAMPTGSILRLSAKNCTTASIAEANGVKDVSGNGNHLRAYQGVAVVKDEVMGECFSFDGTDDYIYTNESRILNQFNNIKGLTISIRIKADVVSGMRNIIEAFLSGSTTSFKFAINGSKLLMAGRRVSSDSYTSISGNSTIEANKIYTLTGVFDYENAKVRMYINAELDKEANFQSSGVFTAVPTTLYISRYNSALYFIDGLISDFRIYPRALSASEIKTIYMFPDDVTFGQLTADLIGANVIKADNLIKTEALITTTAQIDQAVVNNLNVAGNATFQSTLSTAIDNIDVGTRNLAKSTSETEIEMKSDGTSSVGTLKLYPLSIALEQGKSYTVSFYAKCSNTTDVFYCSLAQGSHSEQNFFTRQTLTTSYKKYSFTLKKGSASVNNLLITNYYNYGEQSANTGTLYFKDVKLEEGNKSTSWTPAPEDVDSKITSGDSSTLASAKTYADGKASTAQSNAESAAAAALAAVTNNIYYTGTTKINGGVIQAGSVGAAAIAANSITAEKLSVTSKVPQGEIAAYTAKGLINTSTDSTVPDISGNNNNATIANSGVTTSQDSNYGICFYKSATTGHIQTPVYSVLNSNTTGFALHIKVKLSSTGNQVAMGIQSPTAQRCFVAVYDGKWDFGIGETSWGDAATSGTKVAATTNWTDLTFVVNKSTKTGYLYVNGVLTFTRKYNTWTNITAGIRFGGGTSTYMTGYFTDCKIFNRLLSADEAMALYKNNFDTESGQITADRIATNAIKSRNYNGTTVDSHFATDGSFLNLADGTMKTKYFALESSGGYFKGSVNASSGNIGKLTIKTNGILEYIGTSTEQTQGYLIFKDNNNFSDLNSYALDINLEYSNSDYRRNRITYSGITMDALDSEGGSRNFLVDTNGGYSTSDYLESIVQINPRNSNCYGFYSSGKIRVVGTNYTSNEKTKKDFQAIDVLDKLKALNVCAWRFDEEKLVEKDNEFIDEENIKIEAENKAIDAENAEIEKENEKRKNRKDGEPVELLPLKEHKKLREHRIADKNANHPLNIGCMAGEFNKAFGTNDGSEDCLSVTDTIGVCMRAIQELAAEVDDLKAKLKIQQDEKSEIIEHFNELTKEPTGEDELVEPSFDELLKDEEIQQEEQK